MHRFFHWHSHCFIYLLTKGPKKPYQKDSEYERESQEGTTMAIAIEKSIAEKTICIVDAGIEHVRVEMSGVSDSQRRVHVNEVLQNNDTAETVLQRISCSHTITDAPICAREIYITGKLAETFHAVIGKAIVILPSAALWQAGKWLLQKNRILGNIGIIEISASGYTVLCVNRDGSLTKGLLINNPLCGAGTGINMNRILQKLDIDRNNVDHILAEFTDDAGRQRRRDIAERADRCGVFSSSATVSDKNQGIPLDFALATTIKSEVLKACGRMIPEAECVYLTGGIFQWKFARDCAKDYLSDKLKITDVHYDRDQSLPVNGVFNLAETLGYASFRETGRRLKKQKKLVEFPSFLEMKDRYEVSGRYVRAEDTLSPHPAMTLDRQAVCMALDVGSTMAKGMIAQAETREPLWATSLENHGDTIETIKQLFRKLISAGIDELNLQHIGVTGSGRYQVQKVLAEIYPHLADRTTVLVENYAHARGSIKEAQARVDLLKRQGIQIDDSTAVLVDVGGEDTKISLISLKTGDLIDNAMNIKCSAGTGSLMDTLKSLFGIDSIEKACDKAFNALRAYDINATCAVFLMENASKMRAEGFPTDEILASCYWAIVENMARTLWSQVDIPAHPLVLLHGQTMLSDPLPLATIHRMEKHRDTPVYGLVPEMPGHRACIGLIKSMDISQHTDVSLRLDELVARQFEKKIFTCRGAACGDRKSRCNRVKFTFYSQGKKPQGIQLGGCSAANELFAKKDKSLKADTAYFDTYRKIWEHINSRLPQSQAIDRIVIPRSFAASEQAFLLSSILKHLGIRVHTDTIRADDIPRGQTFFNLDTCAPNIGATGQLQRLASEPHGTLLIPQIDFLSTEGKSLGRTCTVNQGGPIIAMHFAKQAHKDARFLLFDLDLSAMKPARIAAQLYLQWKPILDRSPNGISRPVFLAAVTRAIEECAELTREIDDIVIQGLDYAIANGKDIAIACAREYIMNPGVYDSHIGRLFRDKGVELVPSYVLNVSLDSKFSHIYWKNPHHIVTVINAIKDRQLHRAVKNKRQAELFSKIEKGLTKSKLGLSMVSTFTCGPDSISLPLIQELTKTVPFVLVQSDGAIKELAHLENRVNTFLKQISTHTQTQIDEPSFTIEMLDRLAPDIIDRDKDVIYFPTLGDNRGLTAVLRASGYTCIDTYDDESYDPETIIRQGRVYAGDSICAPFAGVYGDILRSVDDFKQRRARGELSEKNRIYIFNCKGTGPCRQGQYYDVHRVLMHRHLENREKIKPTDCQDNILVKYLLATEASGYDIGLEEWAAIQIFQAIIAQGVLQALYLKGGQQCSSHAHFQQYERAFRRMKENVMAQFEQSRPSLFCRRAVRVSKGVDVVLRKALGLIPDSKRMGLSETVQMSGLVKYIAYGLFNNNNLRKIFQDFSSQWIDANPTEKAKIRIHADGEAYMRIALNDGLFKTIADASGFGTFEMTNTPLWAYIEYIPNVQIKVHSKRVHTLRQELMFSSGFRRKRELKRQIRKNLYSITKMKRKIQVLRRVLAAPLYKSAGIAMPPLSSDNLDLAESIIPTGKPYGELLPYIGESLHKLREDFDLILNIAPSGCMVSTMGGIIHPIILDKSDRPDAHMQTLLSQNGEIDSDTINIALLKKMGPELFYRAG
jgi:activator of 2-hydroxyglutaryl-CoA dehydratase/predicted nucleotide-binding protein (sugar kinase/HSP70/actin superfamily)